MLEKTITKITLIIIQCIHQILTALGLKTSIHHRRIQKLYHSTDISAEPAYQNGFELSYSLREGLEDWRKDCLPEDIY